MFRPKLPDIEKFKPDDGRIKVLVTGCGRSGTQYMTKALRTMGLRVGHERFREDGIVSWYLAEDSRVKLFKDIIGKNPICYIHLVRHPLKVINSMYKIILNPNRTGLNIFTQKYPEQCQGLKHPAAIVTKWWIFWNDLVSKNYPRASLIKIEDLQKPAYINLIANAIDSQKNRQELIPKILNLDTKMHTMDAYQKKLMLRRYGKDFQKTITMQDIESFGLDDNLKRTALKYGYKL